MRESRKEPDCPKVVAIVQARMGSTRLPGKVMQRVQGTPLIELLLTRLAQSAEIDQVVVATSSGRENAALVAHVRSLGHDVFAGSELDVLDRYYRAAVEYEADIVVRITGDCPLIDPALVDEIIRRFRASNVDYASNTILPTYPDGLDTEVFTMAALRQAWQQATAAYDREHVTPFLKTQPGFNRLNVTYSEDFSKHRWTVDEPEDLDVMRHVFEAFAPRHDFSWNEVMELQRRNSRAFERNQHIVRDEGSRLGTGQKLWKRAKRIIPGGSMLLSKRAEMFLPDQWPAYYSRTQGCRVWDMDGRDFFDVSFMGIGTNVLGYSHPEVDGAVRAVIDQGNLCTLNCPEEVYLAERLVELHPWADMVRFARSGGEANAICIRIARAASGRDKVAFCGYHGWHDWYLAANLGDEKNLAGHLLPGLAPKGVPQQLKGSVLPFTYNRLDELEALLREHKDIGVIKMEVMRNVGPKDDFLQKVRDLATARGIVLVFDECTSGFRQSFGGLHKVYGVEPDIATFGKTLGNGYAITAVIGRREMMTHAESTFISSTFWTERIGSAAALKTLEVMERLKSWEQITDVGRRVGERWLEVGRRHGLPIRISGLPAMISFHIDSPRMPEYKTLITQEMLRRGFLATTSLYVSTCHTPEIIDHYFDVLDSIFQTIRECEDGRNVQSLLKGPVAHSGFRRLN